MKDKYKIRSKKDLARAGFAVMGGSSISFIIGLILTPFLIGIPIVVMSFILSIAGAIVLLVSPFYKPRLI